MGDVYRATGTLRGKGDAESRLIQGCQPDKTNNDSCASHPVAGRETKMPGRFPKMAAQDPAFPAPGSGGNGFLPGVPRSLTEVPAQIAGVPLAFSGRPRASYEQERFPIEGQPARFKSCCTRPETGRASPGDRAAPPGSSGFPGTVPRASPDRRRFPPERIRVPPIRNATTPEPNPRIFDAGRAVSGPEHATEESNAVSDPPFLALKARLGFRHGRELLATDSPS
jgi:hypothetical protein